MASSETQSRAHSRPLQRTAGTASSSLPATAAYGWHCIQLPAGRGMHWRQGSHLAAPSACRANKRCAALALTSRSSVKRPSQAYLAERSHHRVAFLVLDQREGAGYEVAGAPGFPEGAEAGDGE